MPILSAVLSFSSFHRTGFGRRKFAGGGPSVVAGRTEEEEKKAALMGRTMRAGAASPDGRVRARAATVLLVAISRVAGVVVYRWSAMGVLRWRKYPRNVVSYNTQAVVGSACPEGEPGPARDLMFPYRIEALSWIP